MAIPILKNWENYFSNYDEGLGSSYERIVLNKKLDLLCKHFEVKSVLEAPSFGFTGLSGINSMGLAKSGKKITLLDNDENRIKLIKNLWLDMNLPLSIDFTKDFGYLSFADNSFDLSWNFSALWFVDDMPKFISELTRVTSKVILLCVPNRTGLGYLSQKIMGAKDLKEHLNEKNIFPNKIKAEMKKNNWVMIDNNYIDCPPWPDIGMPKEKFLQILGLGWLVKEKEAEPISIIEHYKNNDHDFEEKMMKHYWFERIAPKFIKFFWAHHRYFLFIPEKRG